ncbi:MAG TPA: CopG family transcriptional regulator [bacterium]
MPKTITIRLKDDIYDLFKKAADGEKRSISNFIEWATYSYLYEELFVSNNEMKDILKDKSSLNVGIKEAKQGKYHLVK